MLAYTNVKSFRAFDLSVMLKSSSVFLQLWSRRAFQHPQFNKENVEWHFLPLSQFFYVILIAHHVLLLPFLLPLFSVLLVCFSSKAEDRLFRRLFRRYNQFIRPVENVSDPVTVEFEVSISQLVKVVGIENERLIVFKQRNSMFYKSTLVIDSNISFCSVEYFAPFVPTGWSESDYGNQSLAETR